MALNSKTLEQLTSSVFVDFVLKNEQSDINELLLSKKDFPFDLKEAVEQILSRGKAKNKLPDWYDQGGLIFPPPLSIEQSSSQKAAEYKKNLLKGKHLIDLTGGMGVDLITLSDQFEKSTHVEIDPWLSKVFEHNTKILSKNTIEALNESAEDFLSSFEGKVTFFIDPARRDSSKKKVFLFEDCSPDVIALLGQFKKKADQVLIKAAPMIDITLGIRQLEHVSQVHVVSLNNECKEVLFLLDFGFVGVPKIHCVNILADSSEHFIFNFEEEKAALVSYGDPQKYLYEPNASIRKAGAFKSIANEYGLSKIAPNTHLYTSEDPIKDFPGRVFEVLEEANKKNVKKLFPEGKANVISKNHPLTPEQIKKKFRLKDGGERFLIGMRGAGKNAVLVSAKRVNS